MPEDDNFIDSDITLDDEAMKIRLETSESELKELYQKSHNIDSVTEYTIAVGLLSLLCEGCEFFLQIISRDLVRRSLTELDKRDIDSLKRRPDTREMIRAIMHAKISVGFSDTDLHNLSEIHTRRQQWIHHSFDNIERPGVDYSSYPFERMTEKLKEDIDFFYQLFLLEKKVTLEYIQSKEKTV